MEPLTWWDFSKRKIKSYQIELGIKNKREENKQLENLQHSLKQKEFDRYTTMEEIIKIKKEISKIHSDRLDAYLTRAKIEKHKYMDKPSKYFYALEKARNKTKNVLELVDDKGKLVNSKTEILNTIESYYQDLYGMEKPKTNREKSTNY